MEIVTNSFCTKRRHNKTRCGISLDRINYTFVQQNSTIGICLTGEFSFSLVLHHYDFPGLCTGEMLIMDGAIMLINVIGQWLKDLGIVLLFLCFLNTNLMKLTEWLITQSAFW